MSSRKRRRYYCWLMGLGLALLPGSVLAVERVSLAEVVAEAAADSPTLRAALAEVRAANAAVAGAEALYPLTFGASAGVTRSMTPALAPGGVYTGEFNTAEGALQLSKHFVTGTDVTLKLDGSWQTREAPLYAGAPVFTLGPGYGIGSRVTVVQPIIRHAGREVNLAELYAARVQRTAAQLTRDRVASELLRDVVTAYWELWYAYATVEIQRAALELARTELAQAQARRDTGGLAPAEVLSFETDLAAREEELVMAEGEKTTRALNLAQLLGRAGGTPIGQPTEPVPPEPPPVPADAARLALAASPDIRVAQTAVDLAEVQARTADEQYRSRLDLEAYVESRGLGNREIPPALRQYGTLGAVSAHAGLTYELPIGDQQRNAARNQAQAKSESARQQLVVTRQRVLASAHTTRQQVEVARRRVELALATTRAAQSLLDAERARFNTGSSTTLAVLKAEEQLRTARLRAARARVDLVQVAAALGHLTGQLLIEHQAVVGKLLPERRSGIARVRLWEGGSF